MEPEEIGTDQDNFDGSAEPSGEFNDPGPSTDAGETPADNGFNPAWGGLREAIGEDYFETHARPLLSDMDRNANSRITSLNAQLKGYEGYKPFIDQGADPDSLSTAMQVMQYIERDPQAFYEQMGERLGLTRQDVADLDSFADGDQDQQDEAELPPHLQAQFTQMQQFQEQQMQQQQEQQFQQAIEAEGINLDQEMDAFLTANPTWTQADKGEIFKLQYEITRDLAERGIYRHATVGEAANLLQQRISSYQSRFSGRGAPSTLPTSAGGNVQPGQEPNTGSMSKQDFAKLIEQDLLNARNS
jgi:hypothetical protein